MMLKRFQFGGPPDYTSLLRDDGPAGWIARESVFGWPGFGVGTYYYGFMRYRWVLLPFQHWELAPGVVGAVDLRTIAQQSAFGGAPQGLAFVASTQSIDVEIARSLHFGQENSTTAMLDAWESELGYRPQGAKVVDLLRDMLTNGADAEGLTACKPLMPNTQSQLELLMGGHSRVWEETFRYGVHPHTAKVRDLERRDFERQWEESNGSDHCRRMLDFTCKKYRVDDWREFVPQRLHAHVPGRLPHDTQFTEDFDTADTTTLGPDLTWTDVSGDWRVLTNQAEQMTADGLKTARAEHDLSSADHYSQVVVTQFATDTQTGPMCRFAAAAETGYLATPYAVDNKLYIGKLVAAVPTYLANTAITPSIPEAYKAEINGSTLKGYQAGVERASVTDTAITGNTRCGMIGYFSGGSRPRLNDFVAADLAVAAMVGRGLTHSTKLYRRSKVA